jgi:hypothetical protein
MLIFLMLFIFGNGLMANQAPIKNSTSTKQTKNEAEISNSKTKKRNNNSVKNTQKYHPKRESARVIGSIAQIVDDPRDSDNVLSAILNIISIFFKYIQHIESDHEFDHRSIGSNAEMELIVTACYELLNKLNLPDDEKYHIINEVRTKIVEMNEQNIKFNEEDQLEFVQIC